MHTDPAVHPQPCLPHALFSRKGAPADEELAMHQATLARFRPAGTMMIDVSQSYYWSSGACRSMTMDKGGDDVMM